MCSKQPVFKPIIGIAAFGKYQLWISRAYIFKFPEKLFIGKFKMAVARNLRATVLNQIIFAIKRQINTIVANSMKADLALWSLGRSHKSKCTKKQAE